MMSLIWMFIFKRDWWNIRSNERRKRTVNYRQWHHRFNDAIALFLSLSFSLSLSLSLSLSKKNDAWWLESSSQKATENGKCFERRINSGEKEIIGCNRWGEEKEKIPSRKMRDSIFFPLLCRVRPKRRRQWRRSVFPFASCGFSKQVEKSKWLRDREKEILDLNSREIFERACETKISCQRHVALTLL